MSILNVSKLNKYFVTEPALCDVSFNVNKGDRVGVVGVNGAGKSTLFKIITGELEADGGDIFMSGDITVGYLKQREHFPGGKTVFQTMLDAGASVTGGTGPCLAERFEELHGYSYERAVRGILTSLSLEGSADTDVDLLSGGEKTRMALGVMLLKEPDLMLLDEPTNHLDIPTLNWLEGYLRSYRGTLMIISHDRYFLDRCVTRIFEIENCRMSCYEGNYTQYKEKKRIRYEQDLKHYEQQQAEIRRQEDMIRRYKEHNTEHLVKRAQSREKRLAQVERLEKPVMLSETLRMNFTEKLSSGNDVVFAEDLSFGYGREKLFSGVNLDIKKKDRICIVGPNGVGKTTLLKIILGELLPDSGYIRLGQNVIPGYYDQEQRALNPDNSVLEELHSQYRLYDQTDLRKILGSFLFRGEDVFKRVGDLAGGEKARLALLKLMMSGANLLIFDEPTNHLDIAAKEVFEDAVMNYPGTVIIVSHDRYLLQQVPTAILELTETGITRYPGQYDYYSQKSQEVHSGKLAALKAGQSGGASKAASAAVSDKQAGREAEKQPDRDSYGDRKARAAADRKAAKQLAAAEAAVEEAETRIKALEAELCKPEVYNDQQRARQTSEDLAAAKEALEEAYLQWMELQEE